MISAIIAAILKVFGDLLGGLLSAPGTTGKVSSGTSPLLPSPISDVQARARRAGLLLCVATVLGGCGVFERKTEVVVATMFPVDDWPGGWPILAQGEVRVILKDGTIGTIKDAGGMALVHVADLRAMLKTP